MAGRTRIGLIFDCCLRGDRPVVLIEELAYPGFRYAARAARAEVVPVEIDEHGIVPAALGGRLPPPRRAGPVPDDRGAEPLDRPDAGQAAAGDRRHRPPL